MNGSVLHWVGVVVFGIGCIVFVALWLVYCLRCRSALLDLLQEVNDRIPYVMRNDAYSMNPFLPARVWRQHKEFFPEDNGTRQRVRRYLMLQCGSLLVFAMAILIAVFA